MAVSNFLQKEDSFYLLQENGNKIILEGNFGFPAFEPPINSITATQQTNSVEIIRQNDINLIIVD